MSDAVIATAMHAGAIALGTVTGALVACLILFIIVMGVAVAAEIAIRAVRQIILWRKHRE